MEERTFPQTVRLSDDGEHLEIIDQTLLPGRLEVISLRELPEIWDAIYELKVRGAPAIGVAAAYGMLLGAQQIPSEEHDAFQTDFERVGQYLDSSRPTAVNLSWAIQRMRNVVEENAGLAKKDLLPLLRHEADEIHDEDIRTCRAIGENGLALLKKGDGILTHCNAGRLAAVTYGTATAPIYVGEERGYRFHVFCDETRPLLQGIRLTAFELMAAGVDTTVICDNMAPTVMRKGWVQAVLVGADRVAANGDTANKIGTSGVAIAASYYHVPFYVCAPTSSIDLSCPDGSAIPIEERAADEVTEMWYAARMAPEGVKVFNPAFDVTDASLIRGIVTEKGIARPPFEDSLRKMCGK